MTTLPYANAEEQRLAAEVGTWVFLATELMFFGPLLLGYAYGRSHHAQAFAEASRQTHVWLGTLNTALLLTSSLTMALAVRAAHADARRALPRLLSATAALGAAFLAVKGVEYRLEWRAGHLPDAGLFQFLYWVMTGAHSLHLAVAIALVVWLAAGVRRQSGDGNARRVEMTALYWHFVDIVWVFLFPIIYLVERHR